MSAPDPREVLAECWWLDDAPAGHEWAKAGADEHEAWRESADLLIERLAARGVHLSVDGGPPADDGNERCPTCGSADVRVCEDGWHTFAIPRPVSPVGEAEPEWEPEHGPGSADDRYRDRPSVGSASSDGPAAPTAEHQFVRADGQPNGFTQICVVCGNDRSHPLHTAPVVAPATCDGSGKRMTDEDLDRGVMADLMEPAPCGRCGTVGGGGKVMTTVGVMAAVRDSGIAWVPCPDCGGTAPTEASS